MCDVCFDPSCEGVCSAPKPADADGLVTTTSVSSTASLSAEPAAPPSSTEVDALLSSSGPWSSSTITYGFTNSSSDYSSLYSAYNEPSQFLSFSTVGMDILRDAFSQWDAVSTLTMVEASDPSTATIKVGGSSIPDTAWAYSPGTYEANGDIWFGLDKSYFSKMVSTTSVDYLGSYEYLVSLHEIGHSLGLKHPHDDTPTMDTAYDGLEYTVMSYRSYLGGPRSSYTVESWGYPQSLMMMDIAAVQELYGADYTALAGDTTYTFDPNTGEMMIDGVSQGTPGANRIFRTLWDGDGTDLIDLSNYTTNLEIDLNEGRGLDLDVGGYNQRAQLSSGSSVVYAARHVFMSLLHQGNTQSLIENATGGTGDDALIGNQVANVLDGGDGDDTLSGGLAADTLTLGAGADIVSDDLAGLDGDTVTDFDSSEDKILVTGETLTAAMVSIDASGLLKIDTDQDGTAEATVDLGITDAFTLTTTAEGTEISFSGTVTPPDDTGDDTSTTPDPDMSFTGTAADNTYVGGTGNDTFLLRWGTDTATGDLGSDKFILDGRYLGDGDSHTITDLNFSESDTLLLRQFGVNSTKITISSQTALDSFVQRADVSGVNYGSDLQITIDDDDGDIITLILNGLNSVNAQDGSLPPDDDGSGDDTSTTPDPNMSYIGSGGDNTYVGGTGNDTFLFRWGSDTATGDAGSDKFIVDGRYLSDGDSHTITDLDFSETDQIIIRQFGSSNEKITIGGETKLQTVIDRSDVSASLSGSDLVLSFTEDDTGKQFSLTLLDGDLFGVTIA